MDSIKTDWASRSSLSMWVLLLPLPVFFEKTFIASDSVKASASVGGVWNVVDDYNHSINYSCCLPHHVLTLLLSHSTKHLLSDECENPASCTFVFCMSFELSTITATATTAHCYCMSCAVCSAGEVFFLFRIVRLGVGSWSLPRHIQYGSGGEVLCLRRRRLTCSCFMFFHHWFFCQPQQRW